jgi:hypothetical protein
MAASCPFLGLGGRMPASLVLLGGKTSLGLVQLSRYEPGSVVDRLISLPPATIRTRPVVEQRGSVPET